MVVRFDGRKPPAFIIKFPAVGYAPLALRVSWAQLCDGLTLGLLGMSYGCSECRVVSPPKPKISQFPNSFEVRPEGAGPAG